MNLADLDTIAAIATPPGVGGIGIIRVSGPLAETIFQQVFRPSHPPEALESHRLYHGRVVDREGETVDEALAVLMRAPHTYTRDNVLELQCHGSFLAQRAVLAEVLARGARPAEPGEFTKRAFLGGRIDLTRAEAVVDLLQARTGDGLRMAVNQLQGRLYERIEALRMVLVEVRAVLEVAIDFPEDDVEIIDSERLAAQVRLRVLAELDQLILHADQGRILREGVDVVIAGRPNVGKSSLLNALLQEERALVTAIPGTTRDTIEEYLDVRGIPVRIVDTAGIREGGDAIEAMGIERTRRRMEAADLVLFLVDGSEALTPEDLRVHASLSKASTLLVVNKIDQGELLDPATVNHHFGEVAVARISAKRHQGLDGLLDAIHHRLTGGDALWDHHHCAPNLRHRDVLVKTRGHCLALLQGLCNARTSDLLSVDLQAALDQLGDIVGLTTSEEVLDLVFSRFCIGK